MNNEQILREKARRYLVCYNASCPSHEHCLRWQVGPYVPETTLVQKCVNTMNVEVRAGRCPFHRPDTPVTMKRGMTSLYDDMPRHTASAIKRQLESELGHTTYYNYRNGSLPIAPRLQQHIAAVCRSHGWHQPPVYDAETVEYEWD